MAATVDVIIDVLLVLLAKRKHSFRFVLLLFR